MVALSHVWSHRRHRTGLCLHCSHLCAGEVVSRSPRLDYRNRCGRFWSRRACDRACCDTLDSNRRCTPDICRSRSRIRDPWFADSLLYAESSCGLAARGMDAFNQIDRAALSEGVHAQVSFDDLAMVGIVADSVSEYIRRHLGHLSRVSYLSRVSEGNGDRRSRYGRHREYWECVWARILGMDI